MDSVGLQIDSRFERLLWSISMHGGHGVTTHAVLFSRHRPGTTTAINCISRRHVHCPAPPSSICMSLSLSLAPFHCCSLYDRQPTTRQLSTRTDLSPALLVGAISHRLSCNSLALNSFIRRLGGARESVKRRFPVGRPFYRNTRLKRSPLTPSLCVVLYLQKGRNLLPW